MRALAENPERLVGKLDWVTKQHLLAKCGARATVAERQKLDVRYHELSRDGYYLRLEAAGVAPTIEEPEDVLQAMTTSPADTPAELRGKLIRRFANTSERVRASSSAVVVPARGGTRIIKLSRP